MRQANLYLLWLLGFLSVSFAEQNILSYFPGSGVLAGWGIVAGADRKGNTEKALYQMYDGAAPAMIDAGIIAAGQRVYQKGAKRLTADIFRFQSITQAQAYYRQRRAEIAEQRAFQDKKATHYALCRASSGATSLAYLWKGRYVCALSLNGSTTTELKTLDTFMQHIIKRLPVASR